MPCASEKKLRTIKGSRIPNGIKTMVDISIGIESLNNALFDLIAFYLFDLNLTVEFL